MLGWMISAIEHLSNVALLHDDLAEGVIGARLLPHAPAPLNRLFLTAWKSFSILEPSPSCPDPHP